MTTANLPARGAPREFLTGSADYGASGIPAGTCPWCLEAEGSVFCCGGNHPDAVAALAELARTPVVFVDRRMSTSDGAR